MWLERFQILPLAVLIFAAGAAIGTAGGHGEPIGAALVAFGFLAATLGAGWRSWPAAAAGLGLAAAGIVLATGSWWAAATIPRQQAGDLAALAPLRLVRVLARVDSDPVWVGDRWRFEAKAVAALFPRSRPAQGRVQVTWVPGPAGPAARPGGLVRTSRAPISPPGGWVRAPQAPPFPAGIREPSPEFRPRFGDLVLAVGSLRRPDPPSNPGQPDFAAWAARRGVFSRVRATSLTLAAPHSVPWDPVRIACDAKERAAALVGKGLAPPEAALAGSLLFGAGAVPVEAGTRQTFTDLGLAHVLAASGMQTTLLVSLTVAVGRAVGIPTAMRCILAGSLATFFAAMCGFAPSIMRATWMSGAALLAQATGRQALGTRTLWLSALAMLVVTPRLIVDLGFQFSFLATLGLLTSGTTLRNRLGQAMGASGTALRAIAGRMAPGKSRGAVSGSFGGAAPAGSFGGAAPAGSFGGAAPAGSFGGAAPAGSTGAGAASAVGFAEGPGKKAAGDSERHGTGSGPSGWRGVVADGLAAPVAAFIWCTPLQLAHFGRLSLWSLPANWYAEGIVVLLTYCGFVVAGAGLIWEPLATPAPWILGPLIAALQGGLELMHRLPGSTLAVPPPPLWAAGVAYAILVLPQVPRWVCADWPTTAWAIRAALCLRLPGAVVAGTPVLLAAGTLAAGSAAGQAATGALEITVLDVGQGDAIVVRSPGGRCALVDAGPAGDSWDAGKAIVLPALTALGCRRLDLAVVTHPHADHLGGMAAVLGAMPASEVWDAGQSDDSRLYGALLAAVLAAGTPLGVPRPGVLKSIDSVRWQILGPDRHLLAGTRSDPNNNSLVVRLAYGTVRVLLAADLETAGENELLGRGPPAALRADILKAPHHGSRFGTSPAFLAAVRPRASIVSVGRDNNFGHPDPATLARLARYGPVFRTDSLGAVRIHVEPATWSVTGWLAGGGRLAR